MRNGLMLNFLPLFLVSTVFARSSTSIAWLRDHRGVTFQEIVKPIARFQILDQDTYGDPGSGKHRSSTKDFKGLY